jgi:hypothetical protein
MLDVNPVWFHSTGAMWSARKRVSAISYKTKKSTLKGISKTDIACSFRALSHRLQKRVDALAIP